MEKVIIVEEMSITKEMEALSVICEHLAECPMESRRRIVNYLIDRFIAPAADRAEKG